MSQEREAKFLKCFVRSRQRRSWIGRALDGFGTRDQERVQGCDQVCQRFDTPTAHALQQRRQRGKVNVRATRAEMQAVADASTKHSQ